jgi:hypothetical protein
MPIQEENAGGTILPGETHRPLPPIEDELNAKPVAAVTGYTANWVRAIA